QAILACRLDAEIVVASAGDFLFPPSGWATSATRNHGRPGDGYRTGYGRFAAVVEDFNIAILARHDQLAIVGKHAFFPVFGHDTPPIHPIRGIVIYRWNPHAP